MLTYVLQLDDASLESAELKERNRKHRCTEFNGLGYLGLGDSQTTIRYVDLATPLTGTSSKMMVQAEEKKPRGEGRVRMAWLVSIPSSFSKANIDMILQTGRTRWLSGLKNMIRPYGRRRRNRSAAKSPDGSEDSKNKRKTTESVATEHRLLLCDTPQ